MSVNATVITCSKCSFLSSDGVTNGRFKYKTNDGLINLIPELAWLMTPLHSSGVLSCPPPPANLMEFGMNILQEKGTLVDFIRVNTPKVI